jgi:hypothetical protein
MQTTNVVCSEDDTSGKNFIDATTFADKYHFLLKLSEFLDLQSMDYLAICLAIFVLSSIFHKEKNSFYCS